MTDASKKDFTLRISQASPIAMITILYDITLAYLADAKEALEKKDMVTYKHALHRGQDCIRELQASLHLEYDPAPVLLELYIFIHKCFAKAIISAQEEDLKQPEKILCRLRDAYLELEKTGKWDSVMSHTEQVYAGLTYGRHSLVESVSSTGENRGFLA